jgi:uncharacterized tellurite resistance protein B-like protein
MFVQNLNASQQSALLYLAREVAKADGDLHKLQMGLLQIIKDQSEVGITEQEISLAMLPQVFDDNRVKGSLLLELLGVAYSNNEYNVNEKKLIEQYAQALNINEEQLKKLETWVEKQLALMREIEQLLN